MNARLRKEILEALVFQLMRCKKILSANPSLARAIRAVELQNSFEDLYLHEQMLADSVRLDAYYAAIERYVTSQHCVVDIGTGTGVLAFFAAAKSPRKIYALDHSTKMLTYAKAAAEANHISNLTYVASSSRRFCPAEPIDVIVQDQMGIALFDERMVETILDVRDRCLKPGGRILPARFEFCLEPVQLLEHERIPLIQEQRPHGLSFPQTSIAPDSTYYFREIYPDDVEFFLCEPEPVFSFDLATLTLNQIPKRFSVSKPVMRSGQLSGICMYFRAIFDEDISFSTGPDAGRTHWPMLLYRSPMRLYRSGEIFQMEVDVPDLADYCDWSWKIDGRKRMG